MIFNIAWIVTAYALIPEESDPEDDPQSRDRQIEEALERLPLTLYQERPPLTLHQERPPLTLQQGP